ncbi:MAG: TIGR02300 family protein [Ruegeria sp.]
MPKEEWGVKRVCPTTGKRFYDLNKDPIASPYTGEIVEMETGKSRMIAADAEDAATKKARESASDGDLVIDDDDENAEVELDDDLLEDDDDDADVPLEEIADVPSEDET